MYALAIKLFQWVLHLLCGCDENASVQEPNTSSEPTSHLFALLIGIDKYKTSPLSGAIKDVSDVEIYLHEILRTPYLQITTLKDEAATYENIRNTLVDLAVDDRIQKGDAILIYFAGHGSTAIPPKEWRKSLSQIELIVPCDADLEAGTGMISDRQLACHLNKIAEAKGNNIIVILDCCHSGSGTRNTNASGTKVRSVETTTPPVFDESGDWHNIWTGDKSQPQDSSRSVFLGGTAETSHVLLAACGPNQKAREKDGQGVFTCALLKTLRKQHDINLLTYKSLVRQIGHIDGNQSPRCEGANKDRLIFSNKIPHVAKYLHNVQVIRGINEKYVIWGGAIQGINRGAKYRLYKDREAFAEYKSLGITIANEEEGGDIILEPIPGQPIRTPTDDSGLLALQISAGKDEYLSVYAATDDPIYPQLQFFEQQQNNSNRPWQIRLVGEKNREAASIGLSLDEEGQMSIEILDKYLRSFGIERLTRMVKVDPQAENNHSLATFLGAVVFFMKHQKRERLCPQIQDGVEIKLSELVPPSPNDPIAAWKPKIVDGGTVENLIHDRNVKLSIPDSKIPGEEIMTSEMYGLTIQNNSPWPLYASVLFFSLEKFEITSYYDPPFVADSESNDWTNLDNQPCISSMEELAIGHGPSGFPAWQYGLSAGDNIDLGFIKVLLSTRPIHLSSLQQSSAFHLTRSTFRAKELMRPVWCTITIPVVQYRTRRSI